MKTKKIKKIVPYIILSILAIYIIISGESYILKEKDIEQSRTEEVSQNDKNMQVHYIDVGQADSILITQGRSLYAYRCRKRRRL
ncbi:MAG: hypothetical protein RR922_05305 [Clostridia bacterium]